MRKPRVSPILPAVAIVALFVAACARVPAPPTPPGTSSHGGPAPPDSLGWAFVPDPSPNRVRTILFATIPPDYLADRAEYFAANGVSGVMLDGIMDGWQSDIWKQPARFTPDAPAGHFVGEANPLFQACRRMNKRCRAAGIRHNSIKVAFSQPLPDWFDDAAWAAIVERFRQCAIFARDAGFSGVTLDIEYVYPQYELEYPAYQAPGYPKDRLLAQAKRRGRELMGAMLAEFPEMENWHLPETVWTYGPVGVNLFVGMVEALAAAGGPGGFHQCAENLYTTDDPRLILTNVFSIDAATRKALRRYGNARALDWWMRNGSVSTGLWPLGYYRPIADSSGKFLGWSGRKEIYGDAIVGSYADKSANETPAEFRRQYAAARTLARRYVWVYCHGPVLYRMTPEEMARSHGAWNDTLPTVENLDDYFAVLRDRQIIANPDWARTAVAIRERRGAAFAGFPARWWHVGPFPHAATDFSRAYAPEAYPVDTSATFAPSPGWGDGGARLRWRRIDVDETRFVDLKEIVTGRDSALAYSATWLVSDLPRRVVFRVGSNDRISVRVNGWEAYTFDRGRTAVMDHDSFAVDLPAGRSEVLVKCGNFRRAWGFYLRVTGEDGNAVPGLRWIGQDEVTR